MSARCECNFDRWEPERDTGHAWNCPVHREAKGLEPLQDNRTGPERAYDAWVTSPARGSEVRDER